MALDSSNVCRLCVELLVLDTTRRSPSLNYEIQIQASVEDLKKRLDERCPMCRLILHTLEALPKDVDVIIVGDASYQELRIYHIANQGRNQMLAAIGKTAGNAVDSKMFHHMWDRSAVAWTPSDTTPSIDYSKIREYLSLCEKHQCGRGINAQHCYQVPARLWLIDTEMGCLQRATFPKRYLTLSYVWGNARDTIQTTSSNLEQLCQEGALRHKSIESQIPQVIRDAMAFTSKLGERYLWVDRLCIEQDNDVEKHAQIAQMDLIFRNSLLTLVDLAGESSASSLRGVRPGTMFPLSLTKTIYGSQFTARKSFRAPFLHSVYETRGWTSQERVLVARCLYFLGYTVAYHCKESDSDPFCEWLRESGQFFAGSADFPLLKDLTSIEQKFVAYKSFIQLYTRRRFSYATDAVAGFAGVFAALYPIVNPEVFCGLPLHYNAESLLWSEQGSEASAVDLRRNTCFPSWSWAGWSGPIEWNDFEVVRSSVPSIAALLSTASACASVPGSDTGTPSRLRIAPATCDFRQAIRFEAQSRLFDHVHAWPETSSYQRDLDRCKHVRWVEFCEPDSCVMAGFLFITILNLERRRTQLFGSPRPHPDEHCIKILDMVYEGKEACGVLLVAFLHGDHAVRIAAGWMKRSAWEKLNAPMRSICLH